MATHTPDQPVAEVRLGRITATIWRNRTVDDDGGFYSTQLTRLYRRDEQWERAHTFGRDDLLTVAKVADMANTRIHDLQAEARAGWRFVGRMARQSRHARHRRPVLGNVGRPRAGGWSEPVQRQPAPLPKSRRGAHGQGVEAAEHDAGAEARGVREQAVGGRSRRRAQAYRPPLYRLHGTQSIWQFSATVLPPLDHGWM